MTDDLRLSPDALAAISVPEGVIARTIMSRKEWLSWRMPLMNASVAAALWGDGCHPYVTAYQLWAEKSGLVSEEKAETPAMRRGRLLEPVLLQLLREEFPTWTIVPCTKFYSDAKARLGATPDFLATRPDRVGLGIVQGKTIGKFAARKGWTDSDGDPHVPTWVGIQASVEAGLTGASWAAVAAMSLGDGGLDLAVEDVPLLPALMGMLRTLVADFWRRVEENDPYEPEYRKDAALISQIFSDDDGSTIDLSGSNRLVEIVNEREALKDIEGAGLAAARARKPLDAEILLNLGNAARARMADGRLIEAHTVRRDAYQVKASTYRTVKVKAA